MRTIVATLAACALLPALAAGAGAEAKGAPAARGAPRAAAPVRTARVAVVGLRSLGGDDARAGQLSDAALREAAGIDGLVAIGRADIASRLGGARQQQMLACGEEPSCLADLGGALGADYLLLGALGQLGGLFRIELKVVDTRRARLVSRASDSGTEERLVAMVQRLARQLLEPIARGDASPPPGPAPRSSSSSSR